MLTDLENIMPCDTHAVYCADDGRVGPAPSLIRDSSARPEPLAITSYLKFGAVVPPLSPWTGVRRRLPGCTYGAESTMESNLVKKNIYACARGIDAQADEIVSLIDYNLIKCLNGVDDPVLLFSGGVDSGLIASRLMAIGKNETLLLNFSFGQDDPESALAEAMAGELGLRFERVFERGRPCEVLDRPGEVYPQLFADHGTVPAANLAHAVVQRLDNKRSVILDGTGADGAFGMFRKIEHWRHMTALPIWLRRFGGAIYSTGLWRSRHRLEKLLRVMRRSLLGSIPAAVIAQNTLEDVLYEARNMEAVVALLETAVDGWAGPSVARRSVAADMMLTCAGVFAQKAQPILERAGHTVVFPFMDTAFVELALNTIDVWSMRTPKHALKVALSRSVPRNLVYRPKSGFVEREPTVFYSGEFKEMLRDSIGKDAPLAPWIKGPAARRLLDELNRGKLFSAQVYNFIWALVFGDRWYKTAPLIHFSA